MIAEATMIEQLPDVEYWILVKIQSKETSKNWMHQLGLLWSYWSPQIERSTASSRLDLNASGSSSTSAKLSHKKRLLDIYHKNQNLHSTSVNCFRKKQRLNIYQRNQNLHCCHQFLLATRETGFILFLSKFWLSVSSPASHPKAEFALLPSKLANTKVRIHIVAIEVATFRF